jgi:predicted DNA-binding transcriptional regulator AlpA
MNTEKQYINEHEAARMTGLSVSTLRMHRYLSKGLPYIKVGRSVRYDPERVQEYMQAREVVPGSQL